MVRLIGTAALSAFFAIGVWGQDLDKTVHAVQFVTVDRDVRLEVLDWGGSGRPLVLLAGLGNDAHVFDQFAPKLADTFHVYGITRRGFGSSSSPAAVGDAYAADRLGDDVLAIIDFLQLTRPVLVGHSIAGEELSSVGSRHPEKVGGLVYLDAGYGYAFYDDSRGYLDIDVVDLQRKLAMLQPGKGPNDTRPVIKDLLGTMLPGVERELRDEQAFLQSLPPAMIAGTSTSMPTASQSIITGEQKYTTIPVPILAIFAVPHDMGPSLDKDPALRAAFDAQDEASTGAQARAFEAGVPSARVVRLGHANHYVFRSNEADVLREIGAFINSLPSVN